MVDDPSAHPEKFPTEKVQEKERQRLFRIIEDLVKWENTANETVLNQAKDEIWKSWRTTCADNKDHAKAEELFNSDKLPAFHDPFAGGGALPLEAQRLGLEAYASDLNPVAVLINKAMIEIPPKFAGKSPVNPQSRKEKTLFKKTWQGLQGLSEDVRYYGNWMRNEAVKRIGYLYPKVEITTAMAKARPDLKPYEGKKLTVIAWLWARTVRSPNPAFAQVDVPLVSSFMLSTKKGKEAYVEPVIGSSGYRFTVKVGKPKDAEGAKNGTKLTRGANFKCLMSGIPMNGDYIRVESMAGRMGARLMAIVAEGQRGRVYLPPNPQLESIALNVTPLWKPEGETPSRLTGGGAQAHRYGLKTWADLFTTRQLVALTTLSDLVKEAIDRAKRDALVAGLPNDGKPLASNGIGASAYSDALGVYLGVAVDKATDYNSTICGWISSGETLRNTFGRQAIPMTMDYCETNTLGSATGSFESGFGQIAKALEMIVPNAGGNAFQNDAQNVAIRSRVVSTDPPYYDNIAYADLSDFFYVWLRRSLRPVFPSLFSTIAVPKSEELVAMPYRHENKEKAEAFFLNGMTKAMHCLADQAHSFFGRGPVYV